MFADDTDDDCVDTAWDFAVDCEDRSEDRSEDRLESARERERERGSSSTAGAALGNKRTGRPARVSVDERAFVHSVASGASEKELMDEFNIDINRVHYLKRKHQLCTHVGGSGTKLTAQLELNLPPLEVLCEVYDREKLHLLPVTEVVKKQPKTTQN